MIAYHIVPKWIWTDEKLPERNSYVEFDRTFSTDGRAVTLRVAAAGEFSVKLNSEIVSFGTYRDFPDHPTYNEITVRTKVGENSLRIGVFHSGNGFGSHADGLPGLWVEMKDFEGQTIVATGEKGWFCRPIVNYTFGELPVCMGTLDFTYEYDARKSAAEWREPVDAAPHAVPQKRPVAAPHYGKPIEGKTIYREAGALGFDFGTLACGHLSFCVKAPAGTVIRIKNREYLTDGRVKTGGGVHPGDLYIADGTDSVFRHDFRYYGCRYLAFEWAADVGNVEISDVKLIPAVYDGFETPPFECDDDILNKAFAASVKTLRLCWMGRHVSNIWREQAWYPYDGRFEALYDYTLWGMYDETAANLEQMGRGVMENGFMPPVGPAVKPAGKRIWIPYYTFAWMSAVAEHYLYSGNDRIFCQFAAQMKATLDTVFSFTKEGLYLPPEGPMRWDYLDPALEDWVGTPNDPPNAFYNLYLREALMLLAPLYRSLRATASPGARGREGKCPDAQRPKGPDALACSKQMSGLVQESAFADKLDRIAKEIGERCVARYWDEERGLFADRIDMQGKKIRFHSHIQYLFLVQGLVPQEKRSAFIDRLLKFDLSFGSFASLRFLCEGILKYGTDVQLERFHAYVKKLYAPMFEDGGDTIWESPEGRCYAGGNGCLCQGWSSFPAWYIAHVILGIRPTSPGFATYEKTPHLLGGMKRVSGGVMTPKGRVFVN